MNKTNMGKGLEHIIQLDLINDDSIIVDAGSGRGQFIDKIRTYQQASKCKIIGIECNSTNLEIIKQKNYKNVEMTKKALVGKGYGAFVEFTEFVGKEGKFHQWGNIYSIGEEKASKRPEFIKLEKYKVETITLSQLFELYNLKKIDYLKMDVESAEYDIIMSMDNLPIKQISFEVHNISQIKDMINKLKEIGYTTELFGKEIFAIK